MAKQETGRPQKAVTLQPYLWADINIHVHNAYLSIRCLQERSTLNLSDTHWKDKEQECVIISTDHLPFFVETQDVLDFHTSFSCHPQNQLQGV